MPETTGPDFLHPTKKCDVVMKGGITSGVVYPNMICKLAETYRFVSIGGTSAGAIAAAATAAAEYRRSQASGYGFEKLSELPGFLAAKSQDNSHTNLFWLFQPDYDARMLFDIGVSFTKKGWKLWAGLVAALVKGALAVWLLVLLLAVVYSFYQSHQATGTAFHHLSAALWMFQLLVVGLVFVIYRKLSRLPPNGFGLCPGMATDRSGPPALTEWLHGFLDDLAGKPQDEPLTFGDLSGKGIHLRMISTCVTHGRPYGLPIASKQFYFKESEIGEYFPASVIEWMKKHPGPEPQGKEKVDTSGYFRLPHPTDLPVVVAARMSLSFPFLFRAVPLYAVDYSLLKMKKRDENVKPEPGGNPSGAGFWTAASQAISQFQCSMRRCHVGRHSESTYSRSARTGQTASSGCRRGTRRD
jgi:hypothetical protein